MATYDISLDKTLNHPTQAGPKYTTTIHNYSPFEVEIWWYSNGEYREKFTLPKQGSKTLKDYTIRDVLSVGEKTFTSLQASLEFAPRFRNGLYLIPSSFQSRKFYPLFNQSYAYVYSGDQKYRVTETEEQGTPSFNIIFDNSRGYAPLLPNTSESNVPILDKEIYGEEATVVLTSTTWSSYIFLSVILILIAVMVLVIGAAAVYKLFISKPEDV
ncbi:MAG: hypothetical protein CMM93_06720 [Rickettsiales bacterium]|nr:hypothetical protein [Rickettsiales bacterium]